MNPDVCPLCGSTEVRPFCEDKHRRYFRCDECSLVAVSAEFLPSPEEERAHYDLHQNEVDDPHYRRFLSRAFEPIRALREPPAKGLDFGCGPGPALVAMFEEAGYTMSAYDPTYRDDRRVLECSYDFVTSTEVIEHVHDAAATWQLLHSLLESGGHLLVMTKRVLSQEAFACWHYKNDPTHVRFYSEDTFRFVAALYGMTVEFPSADVALFQKP